MKVVQRTTKEIRDRTNLFVEATARIGHTSLHHIHSATQRVHDYRARVQRRVVRLTFMVLIWFLLILAWYRVQSCFRMLVFARS